MNSIKLKKIKFEIIEIITKFIKKIKLINMVSKQFNLKI